MIINPEWFKPEERTYFHQISSDCISELEEIFTTLIKGEIDIETAFRMYEQILINEIDDQEFLSFASAHLSELLFYIAKGFSNIRIHRNDVDEIWFEADDDKDL